MSDAVVVKLSSGEVLVANMVEDDTPGMLTLTNVCRLVEIHSQTEEGQASLVMVPFMPFTKAIERTVLGASQIVMMTEPVAELAKNHSDHFNKAKSIVTPKTGLVLPEKK